MRGGGEVRATTWPEADDSSGMGCEVVGEKMQCGKLPLLISTCHEGNKQYPHLHERNVYHHVVIAVRTSEFEVVCPAGSLSTSMSFLVGMAYSPLSTSTSALQYCCNPSVKLQSR